MNTDYLSSIAMVIARRNRGIWVPVAPEEWPLFGVQPGGPAGIREVRPVDDESRLAIEAKPGPYQPLRIMLCDGAPPFDDQDFLSRPLPPIAAVQPTGVRLRGRAKRWLHRHQGEQQSAMHTPKRPKRKCKSKGKHRHSGKSEKKHRRAGSEPAWQSSYASGPAYVQAKLPAVDASLVNVPPWDDPPSASDAHFDQTWEHDQGAWQ